MSKSINSKSSSALKTESFINPLKKISSFAGRAWVWMKEHFPLFPYERTASKVYDFSNTDLLKRYGRAKNPASPNQSDTDLITRTAMRYPSQKTKEELSRLHETLGAKLLSYSDHALEWLLGGSSKHHRFKDVNELRAFLNADPKTLPPSAPISGLNTVLSAIVYRSIGKGENPYPYTSQQIQLYNEITKSKQYYVPDHETTYPDSRICVARDLHDEEDNTGYEWENHFAPAFRDDISVGSFASDASPSERIGGVVFKNRYRDDDLNMQSTWVSAAHKSNVPTRLGISGSTLYTLATIEWLFGKNPGEMDEKNLELFAGTIIVPTYHRGDYHSIAETGAAFQHYIAKRPGKHRIRAALTPIEAYKKGLSLMEGSVDGLRKELIREAKERVLAPTKKSDYRIPAPNPLSKY